MLMLLAPVPEPPVTATVKVFAGASKNGIDVLDGVAVNVA
jgi:hypothetical protein